VRLTQIGEEREEHNEILARAGAAVQCWLRV
jgi:hypothetical protein